jgi:hypothetical protein
MESFFRMYRNMLPLALGRTKLYYHHDGAFFPETIYFWGTWTNRDYGWKRDGKAIGEASNPFCRWYFSGGLELLTLMLDRYEYTQDQKFFDQILMPMADGILTFYDQHYPRDQHGKIKFEPAQSLETWHDATNPTPEIAGLQHVLDQLLKLPDNTIDSKHLAQWRRLRGELPPLPMKTENGKTRILPAERFDKKSNVENPELYAVFPYRLFGVGKPHIGIGQATYDARENRVNEGWQQDAIQAALLGRAHEAQKMLVARYSAKNPGSRFPAFWGPNYDWTPDQCHGSVANIAIQRMLIQCDDGKIILLPAWPKELNVEFKLHAPQNTTIEGSYHDGKTQKLTVTPQSRAKDIIQQPAQ